MVPQYAWFSLAADDLLDISDFVRLLCSHGTENNSARADGMGAGLCDLSHYGSFYATGQDIVWGIDTHRLQYDIERTA